MTETNIPINYVYRMVSKHLAFNNFPHYSSRLKIVERLLQNEQTRFKDIKVPSDNEPSEYDEYNISDWINNYLLKYRTEIFMLKGKKQPKRDGQKDIFDLLYIIAHYLLSSKEGKSAMSSEHAEKQYKKRMAFPESHINDDDLEHEDFSLDNLFPTINEIDQWLSKLYYIPKKQNKKDTISWGKINQLPERDQLTDEQKSLFDNMCELQQLVKDKSVILDRGTIRKINDLVGELHMKINLLRQTSNIGRSEFSKKFNSDNHLDFINDQILQCFDYTIPEHISGLIENYNDLHNKYHDKPDSPIYTIINEFNTHLHNITLSNRLGPLILESTPSK